jgi:hypothetical protein
MTRFERGRKTRPKTPEIHDVWLLANLMLALT